MTIMKAKVVLCCQNCGASLYAGYCQTCSHPLPMQETVTVYRCPICNTALDEFDGDLKCSDCGSVCTKP